MPAGPPVRLRGLPTHTGPLFEAVGDGSALTVTVVLTEQLVGRVYVITEVPAVTPVTTPVEGLTVATAGVALLQVPPGVALLNVVVALTHTLVVPEIAAGNGLTVAFVVAVLEQELAFVTVRVYAPDMAVVALAETVGLRNEELKPSGPVHE